MANGQCFQVHVFHLVSLLSIAMLASTCSSLCFLTFIVAINSYSPFEIRNCDQMGKPVLSTCKIWPDFESLKCNNFLSVISIMSKMSSFMQIKIHTQFNIANRFWIAYTEQEIGAIIYTSVFCVDKTHFPRPSHNF